MELSIKERVFPSLRADNNWDWYLSCVLNTTNNDIFKYLFQDECTENIRFKPREFFSELVNASSIEEGTYLEIVLGDSAKVLLNNVLLSEGRCTQITYDPVSDVFVHTETNTVSTSRGTNVWIINPKTKELVHFFNIDTFSPRGFQSSSEDLIYEANEHVISLLSSLNNQGYIFVLVGNKSSCTQNLRDFLASLGGLQEGAFVEQASQHLVVGNLKTTLNRNLYETFKVTTDKFVVPFSQNGVPYVQLENLVKGVEIFTRASSSKTEVDGPEKTRYPEIAEMSDTQPYLLANFVLNTEEGQVVSEGIMHLGTFGKFKPTRFEYGSLYNGRVELFPTMEAAQIQATSVGGRLVIMFTDGHSIKVVSLLGVNITEDYNLHDGKYISTLISDGKGGRVINHNSAHPTNIYTCYSNLVLRRVDFSPNNFKALYYKLFGTKVVDIYSYQALMTALAMLGVLPDSVQFLYEGSSREGKYNFRDLSFISVDENLSGGYAFTNTVLLPFQDDSNCDRIKGNIVYQYLAKVHETDKMEEITASHYVDMPVLSYDKGLVRFSCTEFEGRFIKSLLSKELTDNVRGTIVRRLGSYNFGEHLSGVKFKCSEEINTLLQEWWERSVPEVRILENITWSLNVNTNIVRASRKGVISVYSEILIFGNDSFTIDTRRFDDWVSIEVLDSKIDNNYIITGKAPTAIKVKFNENTTGVARSQDLVIKGVHNNIFTVVLSQSGADFTDPVIIGASGGYPYTRTCGESGEQFRISIRSILPWRITADAMFSCERSGLSDTDLLVKVLPYETSKVTPRVGHLSIEFVGGATYNDFVTVTQNTSADIKLNFEVWSDKGILKYPNGLPRITSKIDVIWMLCGCTGQQKVVIGNNPSKEIYTSTWPVTLITRKDKSNINTHEGEITYPRYNGPYTPEVLNPLKLYKIEGGVVEGGLVELHKTIQPFELLADNFQESMGKVLDKIVRQQIPAPEGGIPIDNSIIVTTVNDITKEAESEGVRFSHTIDDNVTLSDLMATSSVLRVPETTTSSYKINIMLSEYGWLYLRARTANIGETVQAKITKVPGGQSLQTITIPNSSVSKVVDGNNYHLYKVSKFPESVSGMFYLEFTGKVLLEGIEFISYTDDKGVWLPAIEGGHDGIAKDLEMPGKKLTIVKRPSAGYSEGPVKILCDKAEFHSDDPKAIIVKEVSAHADIKFSSGWQVSGTRLISDKLSDPIVWPIPDPGIEPIPDPGIELMSRTVSEVQAKPYNLSDLEEPVKQDEIPDWGVLPGVDPIPSDGLSSSIDITITLHSAATISFDYGVSSEPKHDKLALYLNGSFVNELSGITQRLFSRSLSAGVYIVRLVYSKDGVIDKNEDLGWITNLRVVGNGMLSEVPVSDNVFLMPRANVTIESKFIRDSILPRKYREFPTILDMGKYVQPSKWPWSELAIIGGQNGGMFEWAGAASYPSVNGKWFVKPGICDTVIIGRGTQIFDEGFLNQYQEGVEWTPEGQNIDTSHNDMAFITWALDDSTPELIEAKKSIDKVFPYKHSSQEDQSMVSINYEDVIESGSLKDILLKSLKSITNSTTVEVKRLSTRMGDVLKFVR